MPAILNTVPASSSIVEIEVGGILFDMDGVLVRSTSGDERCWTRWAERHRLTASFDLRKTHGRRAAETIREHLPRISEAELKQHLSDLDAFAEEEQIGVEAYAGARQLLSSIPSHRWTVVTSASERMMRSRLASVGIVSPRSAVGGDRVTRGKPDPEGYLRGAPLLSRSPHECLVVEDAPAGIQAGRSAGCQVGSKLLPWGRSYAIPKRLESSHILLMGDTGAGKSSAIRQILRQVKERRYCHRLRSGDGFRRRVLFARARRLDPQSAGRPLPVLEPAG